MPEYIYRIADRDLKRDVYTSRRMEEIVRCIDCKRIEVSEIRGGLSCWCECHEHCVTPEGYCAWGERE